MNQLIEQVRSFDHDRFLAIQLAPAAKRDTLYILVAFYHELARIAEMVSEPLIGHMRLAWWREALQEIEAGKSPRNHPVVIALAHMHEAKLFSYLHAIIDARAADLDPELIAQEEAWRTYCADTAGNLHRAMAHVLDPNAATAHEETIRAQAQAYAMIGLIRAIPFMVAHRVTRFPTAQIDSLTPSPALYAYIEQLLQSAETQLQLALPRELKPLRALASLAKLHVKQLRRTGCNPYTVRLSRLSSVWKILKENIK